jgi:type I restriction enzyme S subunit
MKYGQGTTVKGIKLEDLRAIELPVPPLPVQERIAEILRRADEIQRKRQEATEISESVLPAMFREIFGDPEVNPHGWQVGSLGDYLQESRYGTSERTDSFADGDPVLRIPNVIHRMVNTSDLKYLSVSESERDKLLLRPGDVLVVRTNGNKNYVGRCAVFDLQEEFLFASYLIRLRLDQRLNPHYLVAYLGTPTGRREIDRTTRTSAGQYNISASGLASIQIPVPPLAKQLKFVDQYAQWRASQVTLERGTDDAAALLSALLDRAFFGELTAEWERENAKQIGDQEALNERMPRLLLLAIMSEQANRVSGPAAEAVVLVTALMKYVFLIQMEGAVQRRLYRFTPYHYGPFAKEMYADLEALEEKGLITVHNGLDDKTKISLADPQAVNEAIAEVPEDLHDDVCSVLYQYGQLDHRQLLKAVYEKYPAYAAKSKLRKKRRK